MTTEAPVHPQKLVQELDRVTIRFAGDSGDGMQLTGNQFTRTTAIFGNDLATLPDFPAEIRAPTGSLPGVSGFQLSFASSDIMTPGDQPDALVAMNPAALKVNVGDLREGGLLIVDEDEFNNANLKKAAYAASPLDDGSLARYQLVRIAITRQNELALDGMPLNAQQKFRSRNFYALGLILWLYDRSLDVTVKWASDQFKRNPDQLEANLRALRAGYNFGETTELFRVRYDVPRATDLEAGLYRHVNGNEATALGFLSVSVSTGLPLFYGSYPITPASDILHELAKHKNFGVKTFQAEDEIAAIGAAIGAAYAGHLALTGTSGPGLALKSEALNLAVMTELPLVVVDVQRAGPSTGMPTKTEQSDLLQAMFGRNGDSSVAVVAPCTPSDCFVMAREAFRIALKYMVPVIYLSDGYLGNGTEPWRIPSIDDLPPIGYRYANEQAPYVVYERDPQTLARQWAVPGQRGLTHRIGGLEKGLDGAISYDPKNHHQQTLNRKNRVARIVDDIPLLEVLGPSEGDLLVLGWGGTYGAITSAAEQARKAGKRVSSAHLRYLNPFPANLGEVLQRFKRVLIPELNTGQLLFLIRAKYLVDAAGFNKIAGQPFKIAEIEGKIDEILGLTGPYELTFGPASVLGGG